MQQFCWMPFAFAHSKRICNTAITVCDSQCSNFAHCKTIIDGVCKWFIEIFGTADLHGVVFHMTTKMGNFCFLKHKVTGLISSGIIGLVHWFFDSCNLNKTVEV